LSLLGRSEPVLAIGPELFLASYKPDWSSLELKGLIDDLFIVHQEIKEHLTIGD
jgi:hypothetical protein